MFAAQGGSLECVGGPSFAILTALQVIYSDLDFIIH